MMMRKRMAYNPKFQISLPKIFNKTFGDDKKKRDALRSTLNSASFRTTYGQMVIERIIERTLSGIDKDGVRFAAYSKSYINTDVFKIYAKSPAEVNLKLTGEMLASLKVTPSQALITIELIGSENKAKAHGHKYGIRTKSGRRVKRDFLGLPDNELVELMRDAVSISRNDAVEAAVQLFENSSITDLFGQVGSQPEFPVNIFSQEVISVLADELGLGEE
jgi:hypothetical protein